MTLSLLARDDVEVGVVTASHVWAVGNAVPWVAAGAGAVATQAVTATWYGRAVLDALADGRGAVGALADLCEADPLARLRQVACVPAEGPVVAHTGDAVIGEVAQLVGDDLVVVGNMLAATGVGEVVAEAFVAAGGGLADRLVAGLTAGVAHGGDARGEQAAALCVVARRAEARPGPFVMDVRVDDHSRPLVELRRLVDLGRATAEVHALIPAALDPARAAGAADALARYEGRLGPDNDEPRFWRAVALAVGGEGARSEDLLDSIGRREGAEWRRLAAAVLSASWPGSRR